MRVRAIWQDYQVALLKEYYPHETAAQVAVLTDKNLLQVYRKAAQLGLKKSEEFKNSQKSGRVLKGKMSEAMKATQFKPGQVSWNKGKKDYLHSAHRLHLRKAIFHVTLCRWVVLELLLTPVMVVKLWS